MTVEFDPSTGRLSYSKNGKLCLEQQTSITRNSTTQPVRFCVALWMGKVQIVAQ